MNRLPLQIMVSGIKKAEYDIDKTPEQVRDNKSIHPLLQRLNPMAVRVLMKES